MKYRMTENKKTLPNGCILTQIQIISDEKRKEILGGWIEKEANLSQEGYCWIGENAKVWGDAKVFENARIHGNVNVYGKAQIYGNAKIQGAAIICQEAQIYGNARIFDDVDIFGKAHIYGNAFLYHSVKVCGNAKIYENAYVGGFARVRDNAKIYNIGNVQGYAEICGDAEVTKECYSFPLKDDPITITDNHIRIGYEQFLKSEWKNKIDDFLEKRKPEHPEVYKFFIQYFCK